MGKMGREETSGRIQIIPALNLATRTEQHESSTTTSSLSESDRSGRVESAPTTPIERPPVACLACKSNKVVEFGLWDGVGVVHYCGGCKHVFVPGAGRTPQKITFVHSTVEKRLVPTFE